MAEWDVINCHLEPHRHSSLGEPASPELVDHGRLHLQIIDGHQAQQISTRERSDPPVAIRQLRLADETALRIEESQTIATFGSRIRSFYQYPAVRRHGDRANRRCELGKQPVERALLGTVLRIDQASSALPLVLSDPGSLRSSLPVFRQERPRRNGAPDRAHHLTGLGVNDLDRIRLAVRTYKLYLGVNPRTLAGFAKGSSRG